MIELKTIKIGQYTLSEFGPVPDTDQVNVVLVVNEDGEGVGIDLDEYFKNEL